ncbi:hypothetical protein [Lactococcus lactis]|uniref:hypothetical protein n=1 Tax=Lactococcus lactis TaxID=1358 RepID=UPI0025A1598B|nr:hypothetical protein [Lactococcus lactis]MDM7659491.1 hypothetical protein [Lactococcus lactis]
MSLELVGKPKLLSKRELELQEVKYIYSLRAERDELQEQLNTAKKALTEIAYTRQEIWRGGTLVGFEATEDAKIAYDALAAIGWDGCPVGLIVKNGLTKEELEGSGDE